jgi:Flp pilus assembly protein TadG
MTGRVIPGFWSRWRASESGVSAVEFALVMPMLLIVYLGGFQTALGVATYRKVADTTVELANVTAQYTTMSATDVANVMGASAQIMSPYPTQNLSIVLSEISTDAKGNATVTWSCPYNGGVKLVDGSSYTLPTGMASPSTAYLLVQTNYTYVPIIAYGIASSIPLADKLYMQPRQSSSISNSSSAC